MSNENVVVVLSYHSGVDRSEAGGASDRRDPRPRGLRLIASPIAGQFNCCNSPIAPGRDVGARDCDDIAHPASLLF